MTKEDLIDSLKQIVDIKNEDIIKLIDEASEKTTKEDGTIDYNGIKNPEFLKEILIARKEFIEKFMKKCIETPKDTKKDIAQYIRQIYSEIEKN